MHEPTKTRRPEDTLVRLGVEELEERLELSPVIPDSGETPTDACCGVCTCKMWVSPVISDPPVE